MSGDDIARLAYLGLLLAAVGGYFIVGSRKQLGKTLQMAAIWALIFVGAIAVVGLWDDLGRDIRPQQVNLTTGQVEVPVENDGHFYLTLELDGTPVRFMVDTGATDMVLTERDARRIGIDTDTLNFFGQARTANGLVSIAPVWIESVRLGDLEDTRMRASVNGGQLDVSLLGMSYLARFERVEINRNQLVLTR